MKTVHTALMLFLLAACSPGTEIATEVPGPGNANTEPPASIARYLYVWARDTGEKQTDFFSVWDVDPGSDTYGHLLSTAPMGIVANAHHSEHFMPEGDLLFMNGFMTGNSFVVNVADPLVPVVESTFTNAGPYTYPHSFERV